MSTDETDKTACLSCKSKNVYFRRFLDENKYWICYWVCLDCQHEFDDIDVLNAEGEELNYEDNELEAEAKDIIDEDEIEVEPYFHDPYYEDIYRNVFHDPYSDDIYRNV